jgi:hypothetical protein
MSSESVCKVASSSVDMGSLHICLVVRFMILQCQSGIFWIHIRILSPCRKEKGQNYCPCEATPHQYQVALDLLLCFSPDVVCAEILHGDCPCS